ATKGSSRSVPKRRQGRSRNSSRQAGGSASPSPANRAHAALGSCSPTATAQAISRQCKPRRHDLESFARESMLPVSVEKTQIPRRALASLRSVQTLRLQHDAVTNPERPKSIDHRAALECERYGLLVSNL